MQSWPKMSFNNSPVQLHNALKLTEIAGKTRKRGLKLPPGQTQSFLLFFSNRRPCVQYTCRVSIVFRWCFSSWPGCIREERRACNITRPPSEPFQNKCQGFSKQNGPGDDEGGESVPMIPTDSILEEDKQYFK